MISRISFCFISIVLLFGLGLNTPLHSQSLSSTDLSTINVDDLSDEQILSYLKQAESSGYTQGQLEAFARQRGMSATQISKLRRRIEQLSNAGNQNQGTENGKVGANRQELALTQSEVFGELSGSGANQLTETQRKIYGYDLFQSDKLTFAPNLNIPTPDDYVLGPGDEIHIDLWGATQAAATYVVSTEGTIRPENLRPIYVNGMTMKAFEEMVDDRLAAIYSGLKGDNPSIFYQVSLGNIRTINVSIVGEVNNPGNYALNSLSTVFTALHAAGGPTEYGTFRNIQLIRDNELFEEIDIYDFLQAGIKSNDVRLRSGDVIIIRPFETRVEVVGEVKRPGLFELKKDESFSDVMAFTGGFKNTAYRSLITTKRNGLEGKEILDVSASDFNSFMPQDGDLFEVAPILDFYSNRVQIEGAVHREGEYQLTDGLTLKKLINKADGLRGDVFLTRATIYRTNEDFSQEVIPVDLGKLLSGEISDITLQKEDLVRISSVHDLKEEFYVQISGEVSEGGVFPFFNNMTVEDLIVLSGGLTQGASSALIEISRRNASEDLTKSAEIISIEIDKNLNLEKEDRNLLLQPFDQVYIRTTPGYTIQQQVKIEGEVGAPGVYSISRKDERISDIIKRAKGLTQFAYPEGAILVRRTEFTNDQSDAQLTQNELLSLRKKLQERDSLLNTRGIEELIERLNELEKRVLQEQLSDDVVVANVRKDLFQEGAKKDSLVDVVEIKNEEPVALDLLKILDEPGSKFDFILKEGDVISIPGRLETVRVAGEVTSPLNLRYDKSYSFKDYIDQSGGFMQSAKKGRSFVQYPNGRRKGIKRFLFFKFYPKVEPGATIFVAKKSVRQPMNAAQWIGIASTMATLALTVNQLSR